MRRWNLSRNLACASGGANYRGFRVMHAEVAGPTHAEDGVERFMVRDTRRFEPLESQACRIAVTGFLGARTPPSVLQHIPISH